MCREVARGNRKPPNDSMPGETRRGNEEEEPACTVLPRRGNKTHKVEVPVERNSAHNELQKRTSHFCKWEEETMEKYN